MNLNGHGNLEFGCEYDPNIPNTFAYINAFLWYFVFYFIKIF